MARTARFRISHTRKIDSAFRFVSEAAEAKVVFGTGHGPSVDGQRCKNFGSCSYLGLESRPELREAAHRALDEYGTQFHFSRAYVQCELYVELESLLEQMTGRPVLVAASTSLAHLAALPVLINDGDQIIVDQFAHASLHTALQLLPDVPLEILRHSRMDLLDARLTELRGKVGVVWYVLDGLYSMLGDFARFAELKHRELVESRGYGFHHFGIATRQFDADLARRVKAGAEITSSGTTGFGSRVAYLDTVTTLGGVTELIEMTPPVEDLFGMMYHAAESWDGRDPVRALGP